MTLQEFLAKMTIAHYGRTGNLPVGHAIASWTTYYRDVYEKGVE